MRLSELPDDELSHSEQSHVLFGEALGTSVESVIQDEQLGVMVESPPQFSRRL